MVRLIESFCFGSIDADVLLAGISSAECHAVTGMTLFSAAHGNADKVVQILRDCLLSKENGLKESYVHCEEGFKNAHPKKGGVFAYQKTELKKACGTTPSMEHASARLALEERYTCLLPHMIPCGPHQSTTKVSQAAGCVEPRSIARYDNSSFVHEAAECFRVHLEIDRAVMHGTFGSRTIARFAVLALAVAGLAPSLPRHMVRRGVSIGLEFTRIFIMGGAIFVAFVAHLVSKDWVIAVAVLALASFPAFRGLQLLW